MRQNTAAISTAASIKPYSKNAFLDYSLALFCG
jgi:hypothetical protein